MPYSGISSLTRKLSSSRSSFTTSVKLLNPLNFTFTRSATTITKSSLLPHSFSSSDSLFCGCRNSLLCPISNHHFQLGCRSSLRELNHQRIPRRGLQHVCSGAQTSSRFKTGTNWNRNNATNGKNSYKNMTGSVINQKLGLKPNSTRILGASTFFYTTNTASDGETYSDAVEPYSSQNETKTIPTETGASEDVDAKHESEADAKDKQIAELKDHYLRCLAEQENLRERTRREVEHVAQFSIQKFARDLISTVDVLNLALESVPKDVAQKASVENPHLHNLYSGVQMTEKELVKTLKQHGVEQMNPLGQKFDPNLHEAMFQASVKDKEVGSVFSVQKLGYTLNGRVIRPSQVGVVKASED
ncbi:hypothetical protein G9A89_004211 [Geosiphon pyriformis]|nr:hypothetical protein G9A89_004211 [Geosiphon pyriformis]